MFDQIFVKYPMFLLIFIRMNGMILFNPIFGRRNFPAAAKMAFAFILSVIFTAIAPFRQIQIAGIPGLVAIGLLELAIGYLIGLTINVFLSSVTFAADIIDIQMGISMSRFYDPSSNVSMPVTGSIFYSLLIMTFFLSNGHLTLIKLIAESFIIIPPGADINLAGAGETVVRIFALSLVLALKLAMPVMAIEVISEVALGIAMKAVPQINIFSVGIQMKLLVGIFVLLLLTPSLGSFFDRLYELMFDNIRQILVQLATA